jgi:hypothetical protein
VYCFFACLTIRCDESQAEPSAVKRAKFRAGIQTWVCDSGVSLRSKLVGGRERALLETSEVPEKAAFLANGWQPGVGRFLNPTYPKLALTAKPKLDSRPSGSVAHLAPIPEALFSGGHRKPSPQPDEGITKGFLHAFLRPERAIHKLALIL